MLSYLQEDNIWNNSEAGVKFFFKFICKWRRFVPFIFSMSTSTLRIFGKVCQFCGMLVYINTILSIHLMEHQNTFFQNRNHRDASYTWGNQITIWALRSSYGKLHSSTDQRWGPPQHISEHHCTVTIPVILADSTMIPERVRNVLFYALPALYSFCCLQNNNILLQQRWTHSGSKTLPLH